MKYILLTPVKNEEKTIRQTIETVINQTVLPELWVIIDGWSEDRTREIISEYASEYYREYPWIVSLPQRDCFVDEPKYVGHTNVAMAVREAYRYADSYCKENRITYDCIGNIDGDQQLSPDYFEVLLKKFKWYGSLGATSGVQFDGDRAVAFPKDELPNKRLYRKAALEAAGGFPDSKYAFDTIILAKMRMGGWTIRAFDEVSIYNLRPDTGCERNVWKAHTQFGKARYYLGYSLLLTTLGCGYMAINKEPLKSVGVFCGYVSSAAMRDDITQDDQINNYFRRERIREIFKRGKI